MCVDNPRAFCKPINTDIEYTVSRSNWWCTTPIIVLAFCRLGMHHARVSEHDESLYGIAVGAAVASTYELGRLHSFKAFADHDKVSMKVLMPAGTAQEHHVPVGIHIGSRVVCGLGHFDCYGNRMVSPSQPDRF